MYVCMIVSLRRVCIKIIALDTFSTLYRSPSSGSRTDKYGQTDTQKDGRIDMTKL